MAKKVVVVSGNRSDGGLLEPLVDRLKCPHIKMWGEMPEIEVLPNSDTSIGTCTAQALVLLRLPPLIMPYDSVVILGDRFEALAASLVAYNLRKVIYHVQSSDWTPESLDEGYRTAIRVLSTWHFPIEDFGSLGCVFPGWTLTKKIEAPFNCIVAYHPYKGWSIEEFNKIVGFVKHLKPVFVVPNSDAGGRLIQQRIEDCGLCLLPNLPRFYYLSHLKQAGFIIGNSSSGIIEAPSLGVPTINVGGRQRGRCRASSVIDCEANEIPQALEKIKKIDWSKVVNPYYKPDTVERIAEVIESG